VKKKALERQLKSFGMKVCIRLGTTNWTPDTSRS